MKEIKDTTISKKRMLTFLAVNINTVELTIMEQKGATKIAEIEAYCIEDGLMEKYFFTIQRGTSDIFLIEQ